ncbi:hypothetical protein [Aquitalea sp. LB_tupeE]|uniref:hypothetical protein n=1 Tax=Aquitalea sp. LB_tupeE TaxID=2748078 RepID=UPI0015BCCA6C|nr:hypothetical protein [Aquitalea sp. LB_tupeE]NWK80338.1 hypothetical protein [Aquitalea sp. LB_tupeE]
MTLSTELDPATRAQLQRRTATLVASGMDPREAKRRVWQDYLATQPDQTNQPRFFTPEQLLKNRQALEKVKQQLGIRRKP